MMVAARSMSECAASDRIASDPVSMPTTPLPSVMAADATIEVSATVSLMFRIDVLSPATGSEAGLGRQCANASFLLVHRHILRHGNANDWQVRVRGGLTGRLASRRSHAAPPSARFSKQYIQIQVR